MDQVKSTEENQTILNDAEKEIIQSFSDIAIDDITTIRNSIKKEKLPLFDRLLESCLTIDPSRFFLETEKATYLTKEGLTTVINLNTLCQGHPNLRLHPFLDITNGVIGKKATPENINSKVTEGQNLLKDAIEQSLGQHKEPGCPRN